jgi:hypothetical protein
MIAIRTENKRLRELISVVLNKKILLMICYNVKDGRFVGVCAVTM